MSRRLTGVIYFGALLIEMIIRLPLDRQRRRDQIVARYVDRQERVVLGLLFGGIFALPALDLLTPWLRFARYRRPAWIGWLGAVCLAGALAIFWRSHADLGRYWSPSLELRAEHRLITSGIYGRIRHPMYASQWLWGVAQTLLLPNWISGSAGLVLFAPLYWLRVPREEQMLLRHFGESYRAYLRRTGRVLPRLRRAGYDL
jgi:protein-S-isoprenylcysteine O-methyltransferase Ste14